MDVEEYWWDVANATLKGEYLIGAEKEFISGFVNAGDLVLDVGCGSGKFFDFALEIGARYVGLEADMLPLRKFRAKFPDAVLVCADGAHMPFKDDVFDCVLAVEVVGYCAPQMLFEQGRRVLKNNGRLLIVTSNKHSYKRLLTAKCELAFYADSYSDLVRLLRGRFDVLGSAGFNWIPFGRASNSRFIRVFARLESLLRFNKLYKWAPWVMIAARKR